MKAKNKKILVSTLTVAAFFVNTGSALASRTNEKHDTALQSADAKLQLQLRLAQGLQSTCSCADCK